jgi:hypothetical protein
LLYYNNFKFNSKLIIVNMYIGKIKKNKENYGNYGTGNWKDMKGKEKEAISIGKRESGRKIRK